MPIDPAALGLALAVLLVARTVQSAFGFGLAPVAAPLLLPAFGLVAAAPTTGAAIAGLVITGAAGDSERAIRRPLEQTLPAFAPDEARVSVGCEVVPNPDRSAEGSSGSRMS